MLLEVNLHATPFAARQRFENLHVRLTRDLQITRSHHHATNAVYPPVFPHDVFVWINRGLAARSVEFPRFASRSFFGRFRAIRDSRIASAVIGLGDKSEVFF